mmetsp:Transcript_22768/g.41862  ORF Transcript_22768/g.41862 Transcript_22768/m.41862 type:complete len:211 (-) Transcript_22768:1323-1955(-)
MPAYAAPRGLSCMCTCASSRLMLRGCMTSCRRKSKIKQLPWQWWEMVARSLPLTCAKFAWRCCWTSCTLCTRLILTPQQWGFPVSLLFWSYTTWRRSSNFCCYCRSAGASYANNLASKLALVLGYLVLNARQSGHCAVRDARHLPDIEIVQTRRCWPRLYLLQTGFPCRHPTRLPRQRQRANGWMIRVQLLQTLAPVGESSSCPVDRRWS